MLMELLWKLLLIALLSAILFTVTSISHNLKWVVRKLEKMEDEK